ncbi:2Fe-2S iron-sulfur cluster-binding protein [Nocardioides marmotae]|uniref:2Fe-2S iron-sulfur cluster-binding protein n=1 Tax=Nocardioides marmotae TaxID=2663857 RepID=UPI001320E4DA|nr:2Fe-2S iron-sulfur cluster-binding protein [Nocardioides marmotae]MBC9734307.1 2Fe-2S iron-sulfur cluster binding domain-containing protein [Nocardioides marmotae]MTB85408.1 2Fe-2S iron-sulfur cluster binding domain-containing protein [Nocardioides marmotae]
MPTVVYIDPRGAEHAVDAEVGQSLMQAAVRHGVPGVVGQCGGSLACASCHVYVREPWGERTGEVSDMEDDMLDGAMAERRPESRLSCQVQVRDDLDGLTVEVAPEQL